MYFDFEHKLHFKIVISNNTPWNSQLFWLNSNILPSLQRLSVARILSIIKKTQYVTLKVLIAHWHLAILKVFIR